MCVHIKEKQNHGVNGTVKILTRDEDTKNAQVGQKMLCLYSSLVLLLWYMQ